MISLARYLRQNTNIEKFIFPLTFTDTIRYNLMTVFLKNIPLFKNLFISSANDLLSLEQEIILDFLGKKVGLRYEIINTHFFGKRTGLAFHCFSDIQVGLKTRRVYGYSSGINDKEFDILFEKSIGEFLERYSSFSLDSTAINSFSKKNISDFTKDIKYLRDFHDFTTEQLIHFPDFSFDERIFFPVVGVEDLVYNQKGKYYPVQQIYWGGNGDVINNSKKISLITTSGCAGFYNLEKATLNAIYETIERDAFLVYWLTQSSPTQIILDKNCIPEYEYYYNLLNGMDFELHILDFTTDLSIPVIVCLVCGKDGNNIYLSSSSRLNFLEATRSALLELGSCLFESKTPSSHFDLFNRFNPRGDEFDYFNKEERVNFWANANIADGVDFLLLGEKKEFSRIIANTESCPNFSCAEEELKYLVNIFKKKGDNYDIIYRYCFSNDLLDRLGYKVVRVVLPKLYPMYLIERGKFTNSIRLREFNKWRNGVDDFKINNTPHPFP